MKLSGLQKVTLLDFPGHTACTVFTGGCNFLCPFCHNASLVTSGEFPNYPEEDFFAYLAKRKNILDGVAVTGGEPTLQKGLPAFLGRIKDIGLAVKLDTNGALPEALKAVVNAGLVDYVAMDIKAAPSKYAGAIGIPDYDVAPVRESAGFLMTGKTPFEFRTTVVRGLHTAPDFDEIGRWIQGDENYFLQKFTDSGDVISGGLEACTVEEMLEMLAHARVFLPNAQLRGID